MKHYIGLDVSMKDTFICIEYETGKIINQGRTKTDPEQIAQYLKKTEIELGVVGLESGSLNYWLVEELKKIDIPAICIDARKMATVLSVRVNKTDKNDAQGIADAMRCGLYRQVSPKSQSSIEIGTLMRSRKLMVGQKVQLSNAIRGFLKTYGIRLGSSGEAGFIQKVIEKLPEKQTLAIQGIQGLMNCFESICIEIKKLTKKVEELAREDKLKSL